MVLLYCVSRLFLWLEFLSDVISQEHCEIISCTCGFCYFISLEGYSVT